ncbi:tripartite tricarboxylate transporter TctB family protein [Enterovirga aerilata]|uniref:Tripartite tricarboxylate transporter TctB family protein n=1 Tax=Enterovirga aerilata TaxID=2730920 RepID=A0A849IF87_9HYPH|nr:tripartite tricarboxylate transporter TctB family protein [Enterovirga sp. DB1703]NNM75109.1 tripartite tricarboxylate transporter TctB family protein [Enterovirga sp. DB1703]
MAHTGEGSEHTVSNRTMELVVAGGFIAASILVMYDNWRIGARWVEDGPQAGYFPFYIGLIMFIASATTFGLGVMAGPDHTNFVERAQLKQVLQVLLPTVAFVVLIGLLGIYVSTTIFILFFMTWLGKYPIYKAAPIAVLVPLFLFVMFEIWFLVPLPKGPLETALGY